MYYFKKKNNYVFVIGTTKYSEEKNFFDTNIEKEDIEKALPEAFFSISLIISNFIYKNKINPENIILTGAGKSGYLSQLIALNLNLKYKIYSLNREREKIKKFTLEDILASENSLGFVRVSDVITKDLKSLLQTAVVGGMGLYSKLVAPVGGELLVAGGSAGVPLEVSIGFIIALGIGISTLIKDLMDSQNGQKFIEKLYLNGFLKDEIVVNLPEKISLVPGVEVSLECYLEILYYSIDNGINVIDGIIKFNDHLKIKLNGFDYKVIETKITKDPMNRGTLYYNDEEREKIGPILKKILEANYLINKNYNQKSYNVITGEEKEIISETSEKKLNNEYYYIENRVPKNEYLFFPFINKESGMIKNELREEYIKSQLRSIATSNGYPEKYSKENIAEEIKEDWTGALGNSYETIKERLMEKLEKEKTSVEYPYLDLVKERINKNGLNMYLKKVKFNYPVIIIGICDEDGFYLNDEIGFIYEKEGELRGRVVEAILSEDKELPKISPIVDGVKLKCNFGSQVSEIKITSHNTCYINGSLIGTKKDSKAFENIQPFGKCSCSNGECSLNLTGDWEENNKEMEVGGNEIILTTSKLKCQKGGVITFSDKEVKVMKFKGMTADID